MCSALLPPLVTCFRRSSGSPEVMCKDSSPATTQRIYTARGARRLRTLSLDRAAAWHAAPWGHPQSAPFAAGSSTQLVSVISSSARLPPVRRLWPRAQTSASADRAANVVCVRTKRQTHPMGAASAYRTIVATPIPSPALCGTALCHQCHAWTAKCVESQSFAWAPSVTETRRITAAA